MSVGQVDEIQWTGRLNASCTFLYSARPRELPTDTIVATCNPDDDNNYGNTMIYKVSGFAARTDEHRSELLDHTIPHSVSDSRRSDAFAKGLTGVDCGVRPGASSFLGSRVKTGSRTLLMLSGWDEES